MARPASTPRAAIAALFRALDARDLDAFQGLFAPGAAIVHDDGAATGARAFTAELRARPSPPARRRRLSRFASGGAGACRWIAYENRAEFPGLRVRFRETAVLRRERDGWRILRLHYSGTRTRVRG